RQDQIGGQSAVARRARPANASAGGGSGYHRGRPARGRAGRKRYDKSFRRPRGSDHFVQQRRSAGGLVSVIEHGSSVHSAKPVSDERPREQQRALRTDRTILGQARLSGIGKRRLQLWL